MTDNNIRRSLDKIEPTEEAQARMLANILAHNEASEHEHIPSDQAFASPKPATVQSATPVHTQPQPKKSKLIRIVLPLAACLIVIAGIGVFAFNQMAPHETQNMAAMSNSDRSANDSGGVKGLETFESLPEAESEDLSAESIKEDSGILDYPTLYPIVEFESADLTVEGIAEPHLRGSSRGFGTAYDHARTSSVTCEVFEVPSLDEGTWIIRYENDSTYYYAAG